MFVDSDSNRDGLVSKASFSKLIKMADSIPREYSYAPVDTVLYKTEQDTEQARQKMFDSMAWPHGAVQGDSWPVYG